MPSRSSSRAFTSGCTYPSAHHPPGAPIPSDILAVAGSAHEGRGRSSSARARATRRRHVGPRGCGEAITCTVRCPSHRRVPERGCPPAASVRGPSPNRGRNFPRAAFLRPSSVSADSCRPSDYAEPSGRLISEPVLGAGARRREDRSHFLLDAEATFAEAQEPRLPKVVFSRTLSQVVGNTRLASADPADEIAPAIRPGEGDIAVGGTTFGCRPGPFGIRRVDNEDLQTQAHVATFAGNHPSKPTKTRASSSVRRGTPDSLPDVEARTVQVNASTEDPARNAGQPA